MGWQERLHSKEIDLGLERTNEVARRLGLLRPNAKVVTVAGTNGKGSCVAALSAILAQSHYRFGAFTSPHILHYNERIAVDGESVSDEKICAAFTAIDQARGEISLSYFEFGALAAMYIFAEEKLDVWILEVGLGGRLDAVNVIDADIAVLCQIDLDHIDWLGDTREQIAIEKAGICRKGGKVVVADSQPPANLEPYLNDLGCEVAYISRDFYPHAQSSQLHPNSIAAAIQSAAWLLDKPAAELDISGFENWSLSGRFECHVYQQKTFILDVGHNPAALHSLALRLAKEFSSVKCQLVVAMMKDKNTAQSLKQLQPMVDTWHLCDLTDCERAATKERLEQDLCGLEQDIIKHNSVAEALTMLAARDGDEPIVVTGSFITVAEAKSFFNQHNSNK